MPKPTLASCPGEPDVDTGSGPLLRALLDDGRPIRLPIQGTSMAPVLRPGDTVLIAAERPRLGDLVAYTRGGLLVVHRVVGRRGACVLTRGDGTKLVEPPVSTKSILGRVVRIERAGRRRRFGLGPERLALALLSRAGLLVPLNRLLHRLAPDPAAG